MVGFTKLHQSILESTVWCEPYPTRLVWIAMLAMADQDGIVQASIPGLARRANVTVPECIKALDCFKQPDEFSRTPDYEGRRVEDVPGGWLVLNHAKYREHRTVEQILSAERVRRHRERVKLAVSNAESVTCNDVTECNAEKRGDQTQKQRQSSEAEANSEFQLGGSTLGPAKAKRNKHDELVSEVLACMRDAMQELTPTARGPQDTKANRKSILAPVKDCDATVDDWRAVIRRQLKSVRSRPDTWKFLSLSTLGRPATFQRLLDTPDDSWGAEPKQRGNTLVDVVRHEHTEVISEF